MAYNAFTDAKPVASDNGLTVVDDTRNNLMALRDAVITGAMAGWNYSPSGGTAEEPGALTYANTSTTEAIRARLTWSGGNVTQAIWEYTADDTVGTPTWDAIGTESATYDGSGNVTAVTWS